MNKNMKKYKVYADNIEHYISKEIEAEDETEAEEIYQDMIDKGMVEINESEISEIWVDEIK